MIGAFDKKVLTEAGSMSHEQATEKAMDEYRKYQAKTLTPVEEVYLESLRGLEKEVGERVEREPSLKGFGFLVAELCPQEALFFAGNRGIVGKLNKTASLHFFKHMKTSEVS